MTYSESNYLGSAISSNNQAPFTFTYTDVNEIRVDITVSGTTTTYTSTSNPAGFTITSPQQYVTLSNAPGASDEIRVYRLTDLDEPYAQFTAGAVISADSLNRNNTQVIHTAQESRYTVASATSIGNQASTDAATAIATANSASAAANNAVTSANSAVTTADSAVVTANTANTTANSAVSTANQAVTTATSLGNAAQNTADGAVVTANNALAAVAAAIDYDPVNNVAAIPSLTATDPATYIEVIDATGIESFTPLTGLPTGFVGDSGLTVRISFDPTLNTWEWVQYFANDPNNRFIKKTGDTFTGGIKNLVLAGDASTYGSGNLVLNCENNSHGVTLQGPPHSAAASYTLTLPNALPTLNGQVLVSDLSGNTSFETIDAAYVETPQTITVSKSIGANINAAMIGPTVSIASGTTITVNQNSYLTVLS